MRNPIARGTINNLFGDGRLLILEETFLINHLDLVGMRQVWLYLKGHPYTPLKFAMPGLYRYVRHPLYVGWLLVFWATPMMTAAHLVFSIATTSYILVAIQFEERDLIKIHGSACAEYRKEVPMLVPNLRLSVERDDRMRPA